MEAVVSDFGASLLKLYVPDKDGKTQDVVLGYETLEDYENGGDSLGATVGRVANRIGMAEFELNGKKYELTKNDNGKNTLQWCIICSDFFFNDFLFSKIHRCSFYRCDLACRNRFGIGSGKCICINPYFLIQYIS